MEKEIWTWVSVHRDPTNAHRSCWRAEEGAEAKVQHPCEAEVCQRSVWPWKLDLILGLLSGHRLPGATWNTWQVCCHFNLLTSLLSYLQQSLRMKLGNIHGNFWDVTYEKTWFTKYNKKCMSISSSQDQNLSVVATVKSTMGQIQCRSSHKSWPDVETFYIVIGDLGHR